MAMKAYRTLKRPQPPGLATSKSKRCKKQLSTASVKRLHKRTKLQKKKIEEIWLEEEHPSAEIWLEEEHPLVQKALMQKIERKKKKTSENQPPKSPDSAKEWLSLYIERSTINKKKEKSEPVETDTENTMDSFQYYFLNNISLKPEVVTTITSIDNVQGIGWGFSHSDEGQKPVIQITPCKDANSASLIEDIATAIRGYISENYSKECCSDDVHEYFEISENNEVIAKPFASRPGDELQTVYHHLTPETITGCLTGFAYVTLEVESNELRSHRYDGHYPIVPFHCIFPFKNELIQHSLPEVCEDRQGKLKKIEVHLQDVLQGVQGVPVACGNTSSICQMPMLLKASIFPKHTSEIIASLENDDILKYTIIPSDKLQGYLTGKAGLIGKINDEYIPVIIRSTQYENQPVPFCNYPCNVDVSACKIHDPKQCTKCSFEEALENPVRLQGPSKLAHLRGEVIMLNKGERITLANGLSYIEFWANGVCFPCFKWKNIDPFIATKRTLSGSPVFIKQQQSMIFLGGLCTAETAFNGDFALEIIRPDICEHFAGEIIEKLKEQIKSERKAAQKRELQQIVKHMEKFREDMMILKDQQTTKWCDEIQLDDLYNDGLQARNGKITCKVEYCLNRH